MKIITVKKPALNVMAKGTNVILNQDREVRVSPPLAYMSARVRVIPL